MPDWVITAVAVYVLGVLVLVICGHRRLAELRPGVQRPPEQPDPPLTRGAPTPTVPEGGTRS